MRRTRVVVQCCVWVRTQTACCGGIRARLLRLGSWLVGSCQTAYHSYRADLRIETKSALNPSRVSGWKSLRRVSMLVEITAFGKSRSLTWQGKIRHLVEDALGRNSIYRLGPVFPRTDHQYTGCHSPHRCDVLLSPPNHRAASQVEALHKWQGCASTQKVYNKRVKAENFNRTCDRF